MAGTISGSSPSSFSTWVTTGVLTLLLRRLWHNINIKAPRKIRAVKGIATPIPIVAPEDMLCFEDVAPNPVSDIADDSTLVESSEFVVKAEDMIEV